MAAPIKVTPILHGNASKRFNTLLESQQHIRVSVQEKSKIDALVEKVLAKKR